MSTKRASLGVEWFLPGRKRPFASTTPASSLLITVLAGEGLTWAGVHDRILYDAEARAVARQMIDAGYGNVAARTMIDVS